TKTASTKIDSWNTKGSTAVATWSISPSSGGLWLEIRIHDGATAGKQCRLHQFIVPVDRKLFFFLVDQRLDKGQQVLGIKCRGRCRQSSRHIDVAHNLHAAGLHDTVGLHALDVAAALDGKIDDDRAGPHRGNHFLGYQAWCGTAGDQCSGNDDILFLDVLGD